MSPRRSYSSVGLSPRPPSWRLPAAEELTLDQRHAVSAVRAWDQWLTTPAMLLVWGLGLTLALSQGWFFSHWLQVKLVFVLALSALHGVQ